MQYFSRDLLSTLKQDYISTLLLHYELYINMPNVKKNNRKADIKQAIKISYKLHKLIYYCAEFGVFRIRDNNCQTRLQNPYFHVWCPLDIMI